MHAIKSALPPLASCLLIHHVLANPAVSPYLPFVINTWGGPFTVATDAAFHTLSVSTSSTAALDAVEAGCSACEAAQCDGTVGLGGSPDETCETTLDALVMDGTTLNAGAVAALRRVRSAVSVARAVLEHTAHTMLAGDQATAFAVQNGFAEEDLGTAESREACRRWREERRCQANYRLGVRPDPKTSCGPYVPVDDRDGRVEVFGERRESLQRVLAPSESTVAGLSGHRASHDTISIIAIDAAGKMAAGTSTNGAAHKIPGRVGDGPIVGSGSYVDTDVGGCGATGDGDIMMRFLPCYQAVENMRRGMTPTQAAEDVVGRMVRKYPDLSSGIVVVDNKGLHGGAASGWNFTYSFRSGKMNATEVVTVQPLTVMSPSTSKQETSQP